MHSTPNVPPPPKGDVLGGLFLKFWEVPKAGRWGDKGSSPHAPEVEVNESADNMLHFCVTILIQLNTILQDASEATQKVCQKVRHKLFLTKNFHGSSEER